MDHTLKTSNRNAVGEVLKVVACLQILLFRNIDLLFRNIDLLFIFWGGEGGEGHLSSCRSHWELAKHSWSKTKSTCLVEKIKREECVNSIAK